MAGGLKVRTGLRAPARADALGIGSVAAQMARLDHAEARHGFRSTLCPVCGGDDDECERCDGIGLLWAHGDLAPCGPDCPLQEIRPV